MAESTIDLPPVRTQTQNIRDREIHGRRSGIFQQSITPRCRGRKAALAQPKLPDNAPERPPPGYNILFVLVDQEHFFEKWPFRVSGREYLKANGTIFLNHQGASQVCSSARSVIYTGQHIQHTGVFDNMEAPWQRDMSTELVTIGHRLQQLGYHAAYQGK